MIRQQRQPILWQNRREQGIRAERLFIACLAAWADRVDLATSISNFRDLGGT